MENILTINKQNNILSQEEIESLFKGFIKLIEKNTEQKIKNTNNFLICEKQTHLPKLSITSVKDLEDIKKTTVKIFNENNNLKKELNQQKETILKLRNIIINNNYETHSH